MSESIAYTQKFVYELPRLDTSSDDSDGDFNTFNKEHYFKKSIEILQIIASGKITSLPSHFAWAFLMLLSEAQDTLINLLDEGDEEEEYRKEIAFLKEMRSPSVKLLLTLAQNESIVMAECQMKVDSLETKEINVRKFREDLENLG